MILSCVDLFLQVFYEATATITDAEPCFSFTLCLLSSQSKVSLYIDEIHVFADPLTSADSEYKVVQEENSVGCIPLATLAPILSQLSISDVDCLQDEQASITEDKQETGLRTLNSTKRANGVPSNGKCNTCDQPVRLRTEAHASDREEQQVFPSCMVGRVLEQLTLRVAKIEDLLLRYEKNTLKPIISMEARLQQVEASMELLAKNSKSPAFLPTELFTRAFYSNGKAYPPSSTPEFERNDLASTKTHKPADDTSISVSIPQFVPHLVVTAPAFSCDDDEEEIGASEQSNGFPFGTNKRNSSTSDVLDNTFDSFLSLNRTPSHIPNITATLPGAGGLGPPPFSIPSPQQFFHPSSQQANVRAFSRGTSDHTAEIERQQARHGLQFRQQQEAFLRQLYQAWVAQHPQAQPRQQVLEAHLGVFGHPRQLGTCHPGSEGNLGAPSSVGEFAAYTTGPGGFTGFTAAATGSGVPAAASGRGFPTLATSYVFPGAASGSRSDLPGKFTFYMLAFFEK